MQTVKTSILALLACVATPAAAGTASPFDSYFGKAQDGPVCFGRTYGPAHLQNHPAQKVEIIEIDMTTESASGKPNTPESFELGFALKVKGRTDWYGQAAICKTDGNAFSCFLEADGGLFRLTPEGDQGLKLETGDYGISIEGGADFVSLDGKSGDDKVFSLAKSHAECDAASAFFKAGGEE